MDNPEHRQTPLETLREALEGGAMRPVRRMIGSLHPSEVARLLESLPPAERAVVWELVDPDDEGDILVEVADEVRTGLIERMDAQELIAATEGMELDDLADLVAGLPETVTRQVLRSLDKQDRDRLREVLETPAYYKADKVRAEVFRHFGYFMTETTGHLSEYVPWFRKNHKALDLYCDEPGFGGESGAYYQWCKTVADKFADRSPLDLESPVLEERSIEYCSYIMEAMTTGTPFRFMGNVRNDGFISNLPDGCCVEVPCFADDTGLHPVSIGQLPPQCAALNQSQVNVHLLTAEAALTGDTEHLVHALAMDPLTGAACTLKEIRDMASEMLDEQRPWLPQFEGKKVRPTPVISIPPGTQAMHAPPDPAQALLKRFIKLAE